MRLGGRKAAEQGAAGIRGRREGDGQVVEGGDDVICLLELGGRMRGGNGEDLAAGGFGGADAGGGVFEDEALGGRDAELLGAEAVGFGIGLAAGDVVCGDEVMGQGDAEETEAVAEDAFRGGGDDRPAIGRKRGEEWGYAGVEQGSGGVFGVEVFQAAEFGGEIKGRLGVADGVDGAATVGGVDGEGVFDAVEAGPAAPAALVGGSGADEDAVHIEEESLDGEGDLGHGVRVAVGISQR